jgi:peptide/nickel transport system ATP-binding protein
MLLRVRNLATYFFLHEGVLRAVDNVSFEINENETVALVGESGCGKSIIALSILKLIPPPGRIINGEVLLHDEDILSAPAERLRRIRARETGIVFQEPGSALDPVYTIGHQIAEVLRLNRNLSRRDAESTAVKLLGDVGIPEPERRGEVLPVRVVGRDAPAGGDSNGNQRSAQAANRR